MENLLPPLLILLVVAAIVVLVLRAGARRSKTSLESAPTAGPDAAASAAARLTEAQHRAIYSLIARGLTVQAIGAYREATSVGLVDARNAVILLDRYPQPFRGDAAPKGGAAPQQPTPKPETPAGTRGQGGRAEAVPPTRDEQRTGANRPRPQRFPYRYRAIVSNGRQTLEVASNMLNDEIYGEIKSLAQIGDAEDAAQMLHRHSDISLEDARAFVALL
ncbi:hypothetical protein GCM10027449_00190 [Sinomonas notoginsengisoli]|uniref:hypothetical protein n=1 Tax=Sinomonas notoginsengisoli TaxID=1457311 RepID=UPI001F15B2F0|nr:hypothetical protein [Sinomonas notoginsengisoli]